MDRARSRRLCFQRAAERYAGEVVFLGVDSRDDPGPVKAFIRRYGIAYPNVFDGSGDIRNSGGGGRQEENPSQSQEIDPCL